MQPTQSNRTTVLAVSLELSVKKWKVAISDGLRERPSEYCACAGAPKARVDEVLEVVERLKAKWNLAGCRVVAIHEAGQDGFWIARALGRRGVEVVVCDPASIEVSRHARRAKTDRLDAVLLLNSLLGWLRGERNRLRRVRVPSEQDEAVRHIVRGRSQLQKESGQHRDRMRKLLRTCGFWGDIDRLALGEVCTWEGKPLPRELQERLVQECKRLELVQAQLKELDQALQALLPPPVRERVEHLMRLKGIGEVGATRLVLEFFWRQFRNRRQVGAAVGLVPQPYDSGESRVDQGISKQANGRVRALLIEMSWMWLKYQPQSAISQWFAARTAGNPKNKRGRRIALVAVARRLVIGLWRYLTDGVIPQGAVLKTA